MTLIPRLVCIAPAEVRHAHDVLHSMFCMDARALPFLPRRWVGTVAPRLRRAARRDGRQRALSGISDGLSMTLAGQVWIVDAYTLTFAALLLAGGAMANRFGARAVYAAGIAAFVAASTLCAAAASGAELIGARLLQGIAASLFIPSSLGLLARAYPGEHERAPASWACGAPSCRRLRHQAHSWAAS